MITFTPHFQRYEDRYGLYFELVTPDSPSYQQSLLDAKEEGRAEAASVSFVIVANDQYELAANRQTVNSTVGIHNGKPYRDARAGGWFSYEMEVVPGEANYLYSTYFSGDAGRSFDIYIDDQKLLTEIIENRNPGDFYYQTRQITQELVDNSRTKRVTETDGQGNSVEKDIHYVTVKFASNGGFVGGLFDTFRILKDYKTNPNLKSLAFDQGSLSQAFDPEVTEYTLMVPYEASSVKMTTAPMDEYGLIYVDGVLINDKEPREIMMVGDRKEVILTAKAEDHKTSKTYKIHIVKGGDRTATTSLLGPSIVGEAELFSFVYRLTGAQNVLAQDVTISYDKDRFNYTGAESLVSGMQIIGSKHDKDTGSVRLILASLGTDHMINGDVNMLKLNFISNSLAGTGSISITSIELSDHLGIESLASLSARSVTLQAGILNTEPGYDIGDLAIIAYHYGKTAASNDWNSAKRADLNGDGKIDVIDMVYVASKM